MDLFCDPTDPEIQIYERYFLPRKYENNISNESPQRPNSWFEVAEKFNTSLKPPCHLPVALRGLSNTPAEFKWQQITSGNHLGWLMTACVDLIKPFPHERFSYPCRKCDYTSPQEVRCRMTREGPWLVFSLAVCLLSPAHCWWPGTVQEQLWRRYSSFWGPVWSDNDSVMHRVDDTVCSSLCGTKFVFAKARGCLCVAVRVRGYCIKRG